MIRAFTVATLCAATLPAFGQQPPGREPGRDLAAACAMCHGPNGLNAGGLPDLAGRPRDQIAQQLRDFRDGKRQATIMHQIAKGYTEPQIALLAEFFSAQKAR